MPALKNRDTATVVELTEQQETGTEDRPEEQTSESYVPDRKGSNKPLFSDDSDAFDDKEMGVVRD